MRDAAKDRVAGKMRHAIHSGRITRQPCEVCGSEQSHAHHEDYSKPFDVMWLCALHHKRRHMETRKPDSGPRGLLNGAHTHPESRAFGDRNGLRRHPELIPRGEQRAWAKLTEEAVRAIRHRIALGESQRKIAVAFGVSRRCIQLIARGKTWTHVED